MVKIAIEATGGDKGYGVAAEGASMAYEIDPGLELTLFGGEDELPADAVAPYGIKLVKVPITYHHGDRRDRRKSSIYQAIRMHKHREAAAVIAPGDTAVSVEMASGFLGRMSGFENLCGNFRPGIAVPMPNNNVLIDGGANPNPDPSPEQLFCYAVMGKVFSQQYYGIQNPLVGLVNVGHESHKGTENIQAAQTLIEALEDKGYNISRDFFEGGVLSEKQGERVVVVNGFTGNILLKGSESTAKGLLEMLKAYVSHQFPLLAALAYVGTYFPFSRLKRKFDWRNYAVAPLLGINGDVMIAHGRSDALAIRNAILRTKEYLSKGVRAKLEEEVNLVS